MPENDSTRLSLVHSPSEAQHASPSSSVSNPVIRGLNEALRAELSTLECHKSAYFELPLKERQDQAECFWRDLELKEEHADALAERIQALGAKPQFEMGSPAEVLPKPQLSPLSCEQNCHAKYEELLRALENRDPITSKLLQKLFDEQTRQLRNLEERLKPRLAS
ncbi:MAG: Ferritin-like domain [Pseudomonadota bacterium]|jgi:bacterioferritin (cytochrome b1)